MHFNTTFPHKQHPTFWTVTEVRKITKNSKQFGPMFWDRSTTHSRHLFTSIYTLMHNFNTRSPLIFLGSHGGEKNHQEFLTIRSHVLGPIKRPLTASNQPKHRKTLKMGIKTQVGRKSYLLELSKTRKTGVHA